MYHALTPHSAQGRHSILYRTDSVQHFRVVPAGWEAVDTGGISWVGAGGSGSSQSPPSAPQGRQPSLPQGSSPHKSALISALAMVHPVLSTNFIGGDPWSFLKSMSALCTARSSSPRGVEGRNITASMASMALWSWWVPVHQAWVRLSASCSFWALAWWGWTRRSPWGPIEPHWCGWCVLVAPGTRWRRRSPSPQASPRPGWGSVYKLKLKQKLKLQLQLRLPQPQVG